MNRHFRNLLFFQMTTEIAGGIELAKNGRGQLT